MKSIEEYTLEQPISYQQTLDLKDISYISSVAYYDNTIVIGYFNKDAHTKIIGYTIQDNGTLSLPNMGGGELEKLYFYNNAIEKMQGICINGSYVFLSQSYGKQNSSLIVMKSDGDKWQSNTKEMMLNLECPPYMEQIVCDGNDMYLLFESSASKYQKRDISIH